ncbi:MAG: hypothetical protein J3K34DRAFT_475344 [Monoraphidium minutum]|nr:MAG: hypothetical protein J3K34DRAFT_475344 [Monoraphidium minutum]
MPAASKEAAEKIKALRALTALIDPLDESYEVQRRTAERVLDVIMQLLEDESRGVAVEAAVALAALSDHAGAVKDRLEAGHFAATPEKVALNPVQEAVGELEGAAAGTDALAALTSLNRRNTIHLAHEEVHRLGQGEGRALGALDDLVAGLDVRDDVAVFLDQALSPALGFLRDGSAAEKAAAAALLGDLAEGRPGAAAFLVAEGGLPLAADLLAKGDTDARDSASHLVWSLVKDDRKLLAPAKGALGLAGADLVEPLMALVEKDKQAQRGDSECGEGVAVDNGDSALLLLRALAAQDADANAKLKGGGGLLQTRSCAIM